MKTVLLPWRSVGVEPKAGAPILVDGWGGHCPSILQDCEIPDFAPFRLPSCRYTDVAYAVCVEITGRKTHSRPYDSREWVRVKITFMGDGTPNEVQGGWMAV
jgi:hypothetical protein